jgi:hypothetical protein
MLHLSVTPSILRIEVVLKILWISQLKLLCNF